MKSSNILKLTTVMAAFILVLTACGKSSDKSIQTQVNAQAIESTKATDKANELEETLTVEITDVHGTVTVPVNPKNVVSLDNRTFETLADWGIELAAVPKL